MLTVEVEVSLRVKESKLVDGVVGACLEEFLANDLVGLGEISSIGTFLRVHVLLSVSAHASLIWLLALLGLDLVRRFYRIVPQFLPFPCPEFPDFDGLGYPG